FTFEMIDRSSKSFSGDGGWHMRRFLARSLFIQRTNHLDYNAVIWLDNDFQSGKKKLYQLYHMINHF
ncbi:unnamed protein product, partial [Rotaria sp. Silwood1]